MALGYTLIMGSTAMYTKEKAGKNVYLPDRVTKRYNGICLWGTSKPLRIKNW
jgi:hypothetical protein